MATLPETLAAFFETLGDVNCLKIVNLLSGKAYDIDEIASLLAMSESTASYHLSKLREMGLVNLRLKGNRPHYWLNDRALTRWKQHVHRIERLDFDSDRPQSDDSWIEALDLDDYDRKVLRGYTTNGRLREIPAKHKKERAVVRWLITKFEPDVVYTEHQVNEILSQYFEDYVQLRRCLINFGLMQRKRDGSAYWRVSPNT